MMLDRFNEKCDDDPNDIEFIIFKKFSKPKKIKKLQPVNNNKWENEKRSINFPDSDMISSLPGSSSLPLIPAPHVYSYKSYPPYFDEISVNDVHNEFDKNHFIPKSINGKYIYNVRQFYQKFKTNSDIFVAKEICKLMGKEKIDIIYANKDVINCDAEKINMFITYYNYSTEISKNKDFNFIKMISKNGHYNMMTFPLTMMLFANNYGKIYLCIYEAMRRFEIRMNFANFQNKFSLCEKHIMEEWAKIPGKDNVVSYAIDVISLINFNYDLEKLEKLEKFGILVIKKTADEISINFVDMKIQSSSFNSLLYTLLVDIYDLEKFTCFDTVDDSELLENVRKHELYKQLLQNMKENLKEKTNKKIRKKRK